MEKRTPHHNLIDVQAAVVIRGIDCFTRSALSDAVAMGLKPAQAMAAIQALTMKHFYKSMTTYADHTYGKTCITAPRKSAWPMSSSPCARTAAS